MCNILSSTQNQFIEYSVKDKNLCVSFSSGMHASNIKFYFVTVNNNLGGSC